MVDGAFGAFLGAQKQKIQQQRDAESDKRATETHKANLKYQGLQGDKLVDEMARERTKQEKLERIGAMTGTYLTAPDDPGRRTALQGLSALDPKAASEAQGIYAAQTTRVEGEEAKTRAAFTQQFQIAQGLAPDQKIQKYQEMIATAATPDKNGRTIVSEEEADQLSMMAQDNPEQFEQVMKNVLEIEDEDRLPAGGVVQLFNPETDETAAVDMTDPDGRKRGLGLLEEGWLEATEKTETTGAGGFGGGDKVWLRDFKKLKAGTFNALDTIDSLAERITDNPDAFTGVGKAATVVGGIKNEILAAGRALGFEAKAADLDMASYADTFKGLGIESAKARGLVFDAALMYAAAIGLGEGRALTDADVKRAITRFGGESLAEPAAMLGMVEDVREIVIRKFKNTYEVGHPDGEKYTGDLGGRIKPKGVDGEVPTVGSQGEVDALAPGTKFIWTDGQEYEKN